MSDTYLYILIGIAVALLLFAILLAVMLAAVKKELTASRRESAQNAQTSFQNVARVLSDNALQSNQQMEYLRASMETRLSSMQSDNNAQLDRMRETVDEKLQKTLDERIGRSFSLVRQSLDEVYKGLGEMQNLASGVGDLKKILSNVKTRGIVGEVQLGAILDQIMSKEQYMENVAPKPNSGERVEFAVKMPGDGLSFVWLPIDAKFPGDAYANLMAAYELGESGAVADARRLLSLAFRKAAKDISEKYIEPPYTTEFAVMFLPFEGLYAEAVNLGIMEQVQRDYKVMVAGPSTMAALLNSLQMGFRTLAIQKHTSRVWAVLGAVKTEFDKFADVLTATQQRLNQANSELDKLVGTRTRSIQRTLNSIQSFAESDGGLLPPVDRIDDGM